MQYAQRSIHTCRSAYIYTYIHTLTNIHRNTYALIRTQHARTHECAHKHVYTDYDHTYIHNHNFFTYYSLSKIGSLALFNLFLLGVAIEALVTLAINLYTKISLHMIGIGGVAGAILGLLLVYPMDTRWFFYLVILLAGVVGYARLTITNHTLRQVYNGFMMGFVVMLALFIL